MLTKAEEIKILEMLTVMMYADGKVREDETVFLHKVKKSLEIELADFEEVQQKIKTIFFTEKLKGLESFLDARIEYFQEKEERQIIYDLMKKMIISDFFINEDEMKFLTKVKTTWGVKDKDEK